MQTSDDRPLPHHRYVFNQFIESQHVDVLCFKAAVLFVQANLHFEWKLQLFINVVSFYFVECCKKIENI
jgi:hypothetical protein